MTFLDHLMELRKRIIISLIAFVCVSIVAYIFFNPIVAFLFQPFRGAKALSVRDEILFVNSLFEGFVVRIKVSIWAGIVFSLPVHVYNIIKFVLPGLTSRERKVILISLVVSFCMVVVSFYYGYFQVIPICIKFLSSSGFIPENVGLLLNYSKNISIIFYFLLLTVIVFQIPIVLEILMIMNLINRRGLWKASRYVIVGIFILAAIATPSTDVVSQLLVAVPLVVLYLLTILIAKVFNFGNR
jgi:sec-independent protein translocase protein TatC